MMKYAGGCHCGNLTIIFESRIDPAEIQVRACQCSFCRKHNSRAIADPEGHLRIEVKDAAGLNRYSFGMRTADYFVCRTCGVYVAALTAGEGERRAICILNCLDDQQRFRGEPVPAIYDAESREERIARRRERWMPASLTIGGEAAN